MTFFSCIEMQQIYNYIYFIFIVNNPINDKIMKKLQSDEQDLTQSKQEKENEAEVKGSSAVKKQKTCNLSAQNSLGLGSDEEGAKSDGGVDGQGAGDDEAAHGGKRRRRKVRLEPLLDDDASGAASELYESDSSGDHGSFIHRDENNSSSSSDKLPGPELQGQDIVAGSPSKVPDVAVENHNEIGEQQAEKESANQPDEERGREEMGGIIVYDSYANLTGCSKIVEYWGEQDRRKVDTRILFTQQETKTMQKTLFFEKPRERDFQSDYDKHLWRNLPRFQTQRDFTSPQFSIHVPQQQNVLIFDSRFENGNLRKAAKVNNVEYNLWLENDLNTKGHTQWYYFKVLYKDIAVRADKKTHTIKFNVLNLAKTTSLYQVGMKPCIWSKRRFEDEGVGWFRGGEDVTYSQNNILRETDFTAENQKMRTDENNNNAFLYNYNGAGEGVDTYFTLSFKYAFVPNQDDEVWFSHAIPATYTQLQEGLLKYKNVAEYEPFLRMNLLCQSLAKTPVPLLTITENVDSYLDYYEELRLQTHLSGIVKKSFRQKYNNTKKLAKQSQQTRGQVKALLDKAIEEELRQFFEYNEDHFISASPIFEGFGQRLINYVKIHSQKKAVVITSRVHPGEPQASHMVNGLIAYLLSPQASELRRHFVFRIVPMLNPDGVIYGNYRCSLLGCDLNRRWDKPNKYLHPPIYYAKNIVRHMHQERKVLLFCDLHGHSRKQNAFFYGCCYKNYEHEGRIKNARLRIIPLMCCQKNELFQLKGCRFRLERGREATARVAIFKEFNIMNSFTLECSFFGKEHFNQKKRNDKSDPFAALPQQKKLEHMSQEDYESLGETLVKTVHWYLPGEQHLLEFISGKILDVFYDEFVKFIPPYMLKRERQERERAEEEARREQAKRQEGQGARSASKHHTLNKVATSELAGQLLGPSSHNNNSTHRPLQRQQTLAVSKHAIGVNHQNSGSNIHTSGSPPPIRPKGGRKSKKAVHTSLVGIREVSAGSSSKATPAAGGDPVSDFRNSQDYGNAGLGQQDNPQQAEQSGEIRSRPHAQPNYNYKDSSSDQPAQNLFFSGNDDTDNTNQGNGGGRVAEFMSSKQDMLQFETFFDNIQQKMKRKEQAKAQRAQQLKGGGPLADDLADLSEDEDSGSSSDDQAYKERARRPKKKKKKQQAATGGGAGYGRTHRTAQRKKEREEAAGGGAAGAKQRGPNNGGNRDGAGPKLRTQATTTSAYVGAGNRPTRSPRHQQLDALAPVLSSKKTQAHDRAAASHALKQEEAFNQAQTTTQSEEPAGQESARVDERTAVPGAELTDVRTSELQPCPAEAILRSAEIQGLIKSQLSTGVLNQTEIMQVIQRAILKNQASAQLRARQNKNRLLVNHPQNEGAPEYEGAENEQNLPSAEKERRNQPGRTRREEQLLQPLRIATTDGLGFQAPSESQEVTSPLRNPNGYQGKTTGGVHFNPARPLEDLKESPLPLPARQAKHLGQGYSLRLQQASAYNQSQSLYSNHLKTQGQYSQQTSLATLQQPPLGAISLRTSDPPAPTRLNSTAPDGHMTQSASQVHRVAPAGDHLNKHGDTETAPQPLPGQSPPLQASKAHNIIDPASQSFSISALPSQSHTVKVEKARKFQTLCRQGADAIQSSSMHGNPTDVRELPSVYEGSPLDTAQKRQTRAGEYPPDARRSSQSAMHDRLKFQASINDIKQGSGGHAAGRGRASDLKKQGAQFRKSVGAHLVSDDVSLDLMAKQSALGTGVEAGNHHGGQERIAERNAKGSVGLLGGRRLPSVLSPDAGTGIPATRVQDTGFYQSEAHRHEISQPVINVRQQAQLNQGAHAGGAENSTKLLQYGGWAMSGYTTMPLKTQLPTSDIRESRVSASNNALSKIGEHEPLSAQLHAEAAGARKGSLELKPFPQGLSRQAQLVNPGRGSIEKETGCPRPQLHINAHLNVSRHHQPVGLSPGALGAKGLAAVGLVRTGEGSYPVGAKYVQSSIGIHEFNQVEKSDAPVFNTEKTTNNQNLQHYGLLAQQQQQRTQVKGQQSNQQTVRQSPTAASAGSTIVAAQRRHPRANVMQDLRDQIAHEATALEMLNQRKQLQLQLERQEQLLHQLQSQLISHQMGSQGGAADAGEARTYGPLRSAHTDDYQSSLIQIGSVISGNKGRARPSGLFDSKQLPEAALDQAPTPHLPGSESTGLGKGPGRSVQNSKHQRNELTLPQRGPEASGLASKGLRRNQEAADDAIAAALTRGISSGAQANFAIEAGRGGDLASARLWNARQAPGGQAGSASFPLAAGAMVMQASNYQLALGRPAAEPALLQAGYSYQSEGKIAASPYFPSENATDSSALDRCKGSTGQKDGGLRQSLTKRSLALGDRKLIAGSSEPQQAASGQGLGSQITTEITPAYSASLHAVGNNPLSASLGGQGNNHFSPLTNASLRFNQEFQRNGDQHRQGRPGMFDEVRSPEQVGPTAEQSRIKQSMSSSLHPSNSANRKGSQIASKSYGNAFITSGGARVVTEVAQTATKSGLQAADRGSHSGQFGRPSQAHSATKGSSTGPFVMQSTNRRGKIEGIRGAGFEPVVAHHDLGSAHRQTHEFSGQQSTNIFSSIEGFRAAQLSQVHKQGHNLSDQKRPIIKKDNILFSSSGASVPLFGNRQKTTVASTEPQFPLMVVSRVGQKSDERVAAQSHQSDAAGTS